jgi:hypothetical protein
MKNVFYLLIGSALLSYACACTFVEHVGQVLVGPDALTFPVAGADAQTQCASVASALGLFGASVSAFSLNKNARSASCMYVRNSGVCRVCVPVHISGAHRRELQRT